MSIGIKLAGRWGGLFLLALLTSLAVDAQSLSKGMGISEMKVSQLTGEVGPSGWPRFSFGEPRHVEHSVTGVRQAEDGRQGIVRLRSPTRRSLAQKIICAPGGSTSPAC